MLATREWLRASGATFEAGVGRVGRAQLRYYTATYREWGAGRPVVLIPGLAGGIGLLNPLARCLAERHHVLAYQLRGEEDCFALRRRFGLADLVEDLGEFLDERKLERPALLGLSFGGVLALEFAARYPGRVGALAVQGAGVRFERGLLQRVAGMVLPAYPLPTDNAFVNQFFHLLFGRRQRSKPLFAFVTRQCWETDQGVMAHRFRLVERLDLGPRLGRVRTPTLVLGAGRDLLVSEASLRDLCAALPNCRRVDLPDCGHLAFVAQPERVAEEVGEFLRRVEY